MFFLKPTLTLLFNTLFGKRKPLPAPTEDRLIPIVPGASSTLLHFEVAPQQVVAATPPGPDLMLLTADGGANGGPEGSLDLESRLTRVEQQLSELGAALAQSLQQQAQLLTKLQEDECLGTGAAQSQSPELALASVVNFSTPSSTSANSALKVVAVSSTATSAETRATRYTAPNRDQNKARADTPFPRRKLLKGMGLAATTLAAASFVPTNSQVALAASGDAGVLGNANLASDTTYFSQVGGASPGDGAVLWGDWNPSSKSASPNASAGVAGTSQGGVGGYFAGSLAPILLAPAASSGAPTTGAHSKGELYVDSAGNLYICKASGSPGTWSQVGSGGGSGSYVTLQSTRPGTADTGNINVSANIDGGGLLRARGFQDPVSGTGLELSYDSAHNEANIMAYNRSNSTFKVIQYGATEHSFYGGDMSIDNNLSVSGTIYKGSGSFVIPHPDPAKSANYDLRHCFVEAPTRGENVYRFSVTATKKGDVITLPLPDYWPYLNENPQVWVTAKGHLGRGYGDVNASLTTLTINCELAGDYNVLLIGTRKDAIARAWWDDKGVQKQTGEDWVAPDTALVASSDRTQEVVRAIKNKNRKKGGN